MKPIERFMLYGIALIVLLAIGMGAWDNDLPGDDQPWNEAASSIRDNNDALEATLGVDLVNIPLTNYIINVKSATFGAEGDGSTDDAAAIQAAIDSITRGIVFFPAGTYNIGTKLTITGKSIWLIGVGMSSVIHNTQTGGEDAIEWGTWVGGGERRGMMHLKITGSTSSGNGIYLNTIAHHVDIINCWIFEHGGYCIKFENYSHYSTIARCTIQGGELGGIYMTEANDNFLINNRYVSNKVFAIHLDTEVDGVRIVGGDIEVNVGGGLRLESVNNILVENVWFEGNNMTTGTKDIQVDGSRNIHFLSNTLTGRTTVLSYISVEDSDMVIFENNEIEYSAASGSATMGLRFDADCGFCEVKNNRFDACWPIDYSFNVKFTNNLRGSTDQVLGFHKRFEDISTQIDTLTNINFYSSFSDGTKLVAGGTTAPTTTLVTDDGWYDDLCTKITFASGGSPRSVSRAVTPNSFTMAANTPYIVGMMMKADTDTNVSVLVTGGGTTGTCTFFVDSTWRRFIYVTVQPSSQFTSQTVSFFLESDPGRTLDLYIDDIFVYAATEDNVTKLLNDAVYVPNNTGAAKTITGALLASKRFLLNAPLTFVDSDATPSVAKGNFFISNTTGVTITRFDGGLEGQEIRIISKGAIVFDTTGNARLLGSSTDITTASGDTSMWICEVGGTTSSVWRLLSWIDITADNS